MRGENGRDALGLVSQPALFEIAERTVQKAAIEPPHDRMSYGPFDHNQDG